APTLTQVEIVSEHFRLLGFRGNVEDYYDPHNSLLPDVLARRVGIPITLSLVWCELARRAGLDARGVGFPGHFLVRVDAREGREMVVVDAFAGGRVVDDSAARELLRRSFGDDAAHAPVHATLFEPATPREFLVRMLTNLKAIWGSRGDHARALVAIDR